jgi:ribosome-associated protein
MTSETATKKNIQKLQRAIVDGLEDVKAQDIQVFNTETLSPLFERVIVASGTSNRQTKALAASVRDAVREAGFDKPRTEGEENGEWIIVDCGQAVVHVMQPSIRQYYRLEEIWGDKPVRLKPPARKTPGQLHAASLVKADAATEQAPKAAKSAPVARKKTVVAKVDATAAPAKKAPVRRKSVASAPATADKEAKPRKSTAKPTTPLTVVKVGVPAKKAVAKKAAPKSAKSTKSPASRTAQSKAKA